MERLPRPEISWFSHTESEAVNDGKMYSGSHASQFLFCPTVNTLIKL